MRTRKLPFFLSVLAGALTTPVFALEAPEDNAPPPPPLRHEPAALPQFKLQADQQPAAEANAGAEAMNDTAFLGVISGELPELLAAHLDLPAGNGIVVRSLVPDGPAAKAGVAVNDVITVVAGKAIGSPAELSAEISSHKPGESVALELIHKGKAVKADVTLGSRPTELGSNDPQNLDLDSLPKDLADRVRDAIAGNSAGLNQQFGGDPAKMEEAMRNLQNRLQAGGLNMIDPNATGKIQMQSSATVRMSDREGSVEVKSNNGSKEVTVRDHDSKVTWSGTWNSDADRSAAPVDVRQRVDSLNLDTTFQGGGLRLNFNRKAADDEDH